MATTKTLTPTNQVITIPDFTDKPDNRLQADSAGKLADAVNQLNNNMSILENATLLESSDDLDSLRNNRLYYCIADNNPAHTPANGHYIMQNYSYSRGGAQVAFCTYPTFKMLVRMRHWDTWGNWLTIVSN